MPPKKYKHPHKWSEVKYKDILKNLIYYYWDFKWKEWHEKETREYVRLWLTCNKQHLR